jgi:hypothetical protein
MVTRSSSRGPSPAQIDRDWPYQVALPDDLCVAHNFTLISEFCRVHGFAYETRRVTAVWSPNKQELFRLHCFADLAAATTFQAHFGGTLFDPKRDREGGRAQGSWRRDGLYMRIVESGPLSVPAILRN